jgi:hypothetical protein
VAGAIAMRPHQNAASISRQHNIRAVTDAPDAIIRDLQLGWILVELLVSLANRNKALDLRLRTRGGRSRSGLDSILVLSYACK